MSRVLIFGGSGMLGHKLVQTFNSKFETWTTLRDNSSRYFRLGIVDSDRVVENVSVENDQGIVRAIDAAKPDVIINAVGLVKQLPSSKSVIKTLTVNSIFPHRLAEFAEKTGSRLITISTDCVFNGRRGMYTEGDVSDAEDIYGKSKNLGEVAQPNCLTLRTSIIGREIDTAHSLVEWFLANRGGKVKGFRKAIYSGFPTIVLAEILADVIDNQSKLAGLYHISSDPINKFDLLCLLRDAYGIDAEIEPSEELCIDRSLNSEKFRKATGFMPMEWKDMVGMMANDSTPYEQWRK